MQDIANDPSFDLNSWRLADGRIDSLGWLDPPKSPLGLQLVEDELTDQVQASTIKTLEKGIQYGSRLFRKDIIDQAQPILRRRQEIAEQLNQASAIYRRIPDDVLRNFFDYATCSVQDGFSFPGRRDISDTLQLASVSRKWRRMAVDMSLLWCTLDIRSKTNKATFLTFLARTKGSELDLLIEIGYEWRLDCGPLIEIIKPFASRVRALHIKADDIIHSDEYKQLLSLPFSNAAVVSLDSYELGGMVLPSLSYLRVNKAILSPCASTYTGISLLDLSDLNVDELLRILRAAPVLKNLKLRGIIDGSVDRDPYVHHKLETIDTNYEGILHVLSLPALKGLCLWGNQDELPRFQQRSGCQLSRFGIHHATDLDYVLATPSVTDIAIRVTSLEEFGLIFDNINIKLDSTRLIRSITVTVEEISQTVSFFDGHPYLFAPFITYYRAHSSHIERVAFYTASPFEFCRMWTELYRDFPAVVSLNDFPLSYYAPQSKQDHYIYGPTQPLVTGLDCLKQLCYEDINDGDA